MAKRTGKAKEMKRRKTKTAARAKAKSTRRSGATPKTGGK